MIRMDVLLKDAKKRNYGVAAPNAWNMESVRSIFEVANELKSPVVIDVATFHNIGECASLCRYYESKYPNVVYALNLDHGGTFEDCIQAIRYGFSSIMVDRSELPFEDNVREVAELVKIAHACGVSVEAELGHVGVGEEYETTRDAGLTRLEEAKEFVERTNVDCLAVSVGTSHGTYKGEPHLEFELLKKLSNEIEIPLVLHGGSGTGDENLYKAVKLGIQKINLATDLIVNGMDYMFESFGENNCNVERNTVYGASLLDSFSEGYKNKLAYYMNLFESTGKAGEND